jgi:DNA-binding NarL/FixJ family response regulator
MSTNSVDSSRILIVDDHPLFREGLRQLIDHEADLKVCGESPDAESAREAIAQLKPDLAIVDISLGGANGIDLIKSLKAEHEELPVLVVSMHDESLYAERALRAGALGYVMKHEPAKIVKLAIRKALKGEVYLSERMSSSMLSRVVRGKSEPNGSPIDTLSDRELEVFQMLGQGKSVRQIAEDLGLSIPTINSFRNRIKEKLHLKSSTEVMLHAIQWLRDGMEK